MQRRTWDRPSNRSQQCTGFEANLFRDPTPRSYSRHRSRAPVEPNPTRPNCSTPVDLTRKNIVESLVYRHVMCRACGVICTLDGPERNVRAPKSFHQQLTASNRATSTSERRSS